MNDTPHTTDKARGNPWCKGQSVALPRERQGFKRILFLGHM